MVAALALALVAMAVVWWFRFRPLVSTDDARVAAPVVTVVAQGAGGRVERVLVREGDVAQAGAPLAELDATAERSQVERAAALLGLAEAREGEAEFQVRLEERLSRVAEARANASVRSAKAVELRTMRGARSEEVAKASADVAAAEALAAEARSQLERTQELAQAGAMATAGLESERRTHAEGRHGLFDAISHATGRGLHRHRPARLDSRTPLDVSPRSGGTRARRNAARVRRSIPPPRRTRSRSSGTHA